MALLVGHQYEKNIQLKFFLVMTLKVTHKKTEETEDVPGTTQKKNSGQSK